MDKRIILAVAGSGKTHYIANDFEEKQRVLLISFTNSNVNNIKKELVNRFGEVDFKNILYMTFDSFVLNFLVKPMETEYPILKGQRSEGINIVDIPVDDSRKPKYIKIDDKRHYMDANNKLYISRISKLFNKQSSGLKKRIVQRISMFFDAIYFDEFQDYKANDFKAMKYVFEKVECKVEAVGDIFQSQLTPTREFTSNGEFPFKIINCKEDLQKHFKRIEIVDNLLDKSRRVSPEVCEFIRKNLNIDIYSDLENALNGKIKFLSSLEDIDKIMKDKTIPKLIWNKTVAHVNGENFINWSYSKGDTYKQTCVILTKNLDQLEKWQSISGKTKNGLYVALTRAETNVYIIKDTDYKKWKKEQ
ncbi:MULTISPECIES: UvrD-helicase domain-containing protein [Staphylococcus]|uniref:UvrD-like helicase ATP-binding domain-containing protein n=2 Tax=Staphylococcus simulans TaxID=1286 RepID=A0ABP2YY15_STASI|nr:MULTISPECIES: UvrD-helicase domain-containing protein [Staphylococcus]ERS94593.1 hypothetical protein SSIM_00435 [Staphylococcus simulans UMC-CNS-990]OFU78968.1 hypothetical protein HMPREF3110_05280 [Staphylococcus sp. HMSC10C03]PNZ42874.1 hypothetical protein CD112_09015 [Staphylococcus simulans]SQE72968.1 Viral (Superfamily 1) RNA helicase [Staphylococcus simulans]